MLFTNNAISYSLHSMNISNAFTDCQPLQITVSQRPNHEEEHIRWWWFQQRPNWWWSRSGWNRSWIALLALQLIGMAWVCIASNAKSETFVFSKFMNSADLRLWIWCMQCMHVQLMSNGVLSERPCPDDKVMRSGLPSEASNGNVYGLFVSTTFNEFCWTTISAIIWTT